MIFRILVFYLGLSQFTADKSHLAQHFLPGFFQAITKLCLFYFIPSYYIILFVIFVIRKYYIISSYLHTNEGWFFRGFRDIYRIHVFQT